MPPHDRPLSTLLSSTDGERFVGDVEQDGAPREHVEPRRDPSEEAEEF